MEEKEEAAAGEAKDYEPYNSKYCKAIDCEHRHGNKCRIPKCVHPKKIRWWTKYVDKGGQ